MNTPFPPPPAAPEKKRKLWPWFLGGCLTLIVLGGLAVAAMFYFGAKAVSAGGKEIVAQVPAVQEHFGAVTDAGMDFGAMMEASQAGRSVMIFNITGEKGEGRLVIETDQATQAFKSATLTLPSGETLEVDAATMKQLQALQP
ncbi:hypothetical protein [Silanimonas sp.]|jgi:hypothetical protein|uniref:hypothetical protein n=1 Tax=Silanimonas sp. TaxID=1929290 RepID=UPI0022BABCFB|nr:hypothetical protein [Silanimonas sp.]MCZ8061629.1 hypothetical protein [Silanimonas sp.]